MLSGLLRAPLVRLRAWQLSKLFWQHSMRKLVASSSGGQKMPGSEFFESGKKAEG